MHTKKHHHNNNHNNNHKNHKDKKSKKMNHHHHEYEATFHGLQEWYKKKVEKLGWVVIAHHKGNMDKVKCYLSGLERLKLSIEHKMKHMHDTDKKHDLEIMHENIIVIMDHAKKDFEI